MAVDKGAPLNPVKPGDLEGCTDDGVTKAKGDHVSAVQALTGLMTRQGEPGLLGLGTASTRKHHVRDAVITDTRLPDGFAVAHEHETHQFVHQALLRASIGKPPVGVNAGGIC